MKRLLPFALLAGCVTAQPSSSALTVTDVWARHHELDGKMIRVQGVVTRCYQYGCSLYPSSTDRSKWLGIGSSDSFDDAVVSYIGKPIIVAGRLRADCLHANADPDNHLRPEDGQPNFVVCMDRARMIMEPQLVGVVR